MRGIMRLCLHRSSRLLPAALFLAATAVAQRGKETIHITTATTDITGLAKSISAQTGLKYSLNMQNVSLQKKITIRPGNYPLSDVLEQIKKQAALQYKILGTHILFIDYSAGHASVKPTPPPVAAQVHHTVVKPTPKAVAAKAGVNGKTPSVKRVVLTPADTVEVMRPLQAAAPTDRLASLLIARLQSADSARAAAAMVPVKKAAAPDKTAAAGGNVEAAAGIKWNWEQPVIKAGLSFDELFYGGVHVQAGMQWLYGIAAYGTDFKNGQFRWGAGFSLPVTENGRIHLNFTTGSSSSWYPQDTVYFRDVLEKERLHRIGLAWSHTISNRLSVQVQLHYNILHQSFTATDTSSMAIPLIDNFDERYRVFKPPYTITKSLGSNTADKSWVGLQIGLFYRFL